MNQACARARVTQPSPHIFLHICTKFSIVFRIPCLLNFIHVEVITRFLDNLKITSKGGFASVYEVFNSEKEMFALKVVNLDDENNVK